MGKPAKAKTPRADGATSPPAKPPEPAGPLSKDEFDKKCEGISKALAQKCRAMAATTAGRQTSEAKVSDPVLGKMLTKDAGMLARKLHEVAVKMTQKQNDGSNPEELAQQLSERQKSFMDEFNEKAKQDPKNPKKKKKLTEEEELHISYSVEIYARQCAIFMVLMQKKAQGVQGNALQRQQSSVASIKEEQKQVDSDQPMRLTAAALEGHSGNENIRQSAPSVSGMSDAKWEESSTLSTESSMERNAAQKSEMISRMLSQMTGSGLGQLKALMHSATSKSMREPNLELNQKICEIIRDEGDDAVQKVIPFMKFRLSEGVRKPQLLTLEIVDMAMRMSGLHFQKAVANPAFLEKVNKILEFLRFKDKMNATASDIAVKDKILGLYRVWSEAFKDEKELETLKKEYTKLKSQGVIFPPIPGSKKKLTKDQIRENAKKATLPEAMRGVVQPWGKANEETEEEAPAPPPEAETEPDHKPEPEPEPEPEPVKEVKQKEVESPKKRKASRGGCGIGACTGGGRKKKGTKEELEALANNANEEEPLADNSQVDFMAELNESKSKSKPKKSNPPLMKQLSGIKEEDEPPPSARPPPSGNKQSPLVRNNKGGRPLTSNGQVTPLAVGKGKEAPPLNKVPRATPGKSSSPSPLKKTASNSSLNSKTKGGSPTASPRKKPNLSVNTSPQGTPRSSAASSPRSKKP